MIEALIRSSLHNRAVVVAAAILLCAGGLYITARMPIDVFPDLTAPTVTVITEAHGMAPLEVETQITFPIEAALNGSPGVRRVRSSTSVGISVVWVEFDWGTDIYTARQVVGEKLTLVADDLPAESERPVLAPISSIMGEILFLSLTSETHSPIELRTIADTALRRRLLSVPGVSQVAPIGGDVKQYQVQLSPEKLLHYNVSVDQISRALSSSNENVSAGFLLEGGSAYLVKGAGRFTSLSDIEQTVVSAVEGVPIRIADLGKVQIGAAPKLGEGSANGIHAVILGVQKQPGVNTLALTQELDRILDDVAERLPEGVNMDKHIFRQADFIEIAVRNVRHALRDGAILVIAIMLLFLVNLRATFITLTAIPLSLLAAVLALKAFGATINTMTLGGLAIAIGALVDDAVIAVENIFRRLRENGRRLPEERESPFAVVYRGSVEIVGSIVFATLIIILVFLPIFFLSGVEGRLLQPLGLAYVVAIFASLVVAVTVTPVLCHLLLPQSKAVSGGEEFLLVRLLKSSYGTLLGPTLRHPKMVATGGGLLLIGALGALPFLGHEFLPEFNEGSLTISATTLPGTSLRESDALGRIVEEILLSHPEVTSVARRTGRAELDEHAEGVEAAELEVSLVRGDRNQQEFLEALRRDLSMVPGMNFIIGQPISHRIDHMLSGSRASVAIKIFGDDLYKLRRLAESARQAMEDIEGVVDLTVEPQRDVPVLSVRFLRDALAAHGVMIRQAARALEAATQGLKVTQVLEGKVAFDLVIRLAGSPTWTLETIGEIPVDTPAGAKIPLKALADIRKITGPNVIGREEVERKMVVMCNAAGRDVTSVVEDCKKRIDPIIAGIPGYRVAYGGQFESAAEARRLLFLLGMAVIFGIGFLLYLAFHSGWDTALVMLNLPLALIGGVAGVFVSGGILSVASMIGFITVFGIATRNGIMLVSHIRQLQKGEGVLDFQEAVFRGALERLVPILMTALGTGLALVPLALRGDLPGNEIQTPMAIVILFGLLTSMLLNMIVVPALYLRYGRPIAIDGGKDQ